MSVMMETRSERKKRASRMTAGDRVFNLFAIALVSLLTLIVLIPLMNVVASSFSNPKAVRDGRVWFWPVEPTFENYKAILNYSHVWLGYRNTIFYTLCGTLINVSMTLICAYPLSQKQFGGRKFFNLLFFFPMLFNAGMIPNYMLMRDIGFLNTVWAILIPGAISIYNMIITRTFIQTSIPESIAEAAMLDGCSVFRYFFSFILPLSKTIIAVIAMYYAVDHWNAYFNAFLYLNNSELYPLQLFLREILISSSFAAGAVDDPELMEQMKSLANTLKYVVIVVATFPLMCIYPFVQKYFIKGVMIGSVKG